LTGKDAERAPDDYVSTLFDQYAEHFDAHLVGVLKYNVPQQLADAMRNAWQEGSGRECRVLDLGCGTGLMGAALAPLRMQLTGVDLSAKMLDKARARNIYMRLEQSDLLAMMAAEPDCSYDAIVAADVFVYIGKLEELFAEAFRLLMPRGIFAFSVESADALGDPNATEIATYRLQDTGRYVHARAYIESLAAASGFESVEVRATQGRENLGAPVAAYLVVLSRASESTKSQTVSRP
jgi:predicted TPR repeat methyltransferase